MREQQESYARAGARRVARTATRRHGIAIWTLLLAVMLTLTAPNGLFVARDFVIRDDDTIYVTEAPYAQWSKSISLIAGGLTPVANVATLTGG